LRASRTDLSAQIDDKNSDGSIYKMFRIAISGLMAVISLCLAGCGGGGGGSKAPNQLSISLNSRSVTQTAEVGNATAPTQTILVTVLNMPQDGVDIYAGLDHSSNGIAWADFEGTSETAGTITIQFRAPTQVQPGTYNDTITFQACYDERCDRQLQGSPASISVSYTVTGTLLSATIDNTALSVTGSLRGPTQVESTANVTISPAPASAPVAVLSGYSELVQQVSLDAAVNGVSTLHLTMRPPQGFGTAGAHQETVQVQICYDYTCAVQLAGSPLTLSVTYNIEDNAVSEPGVPELPYLTRTPLSHNVVDAEYSKALDAIVMVSSSPTRSLYVYDVSTGTSRSLLLNRDPTSVSIAPDGLHAAVGHDALITYVDLTTVGQPAAPPPVLLNVSTDVLDIVLDGRGVAHALPAADQWETVHSVEVATNVESLGTSSIYAGSKGRLHPSGDYLYLADNGLSPSDIEKIDIRTLPATSLYDSPYHGDYGMCGDLWFKEDGSVIYTRCGNTFRSSITQSQDMLYNGRLELSTSQYYGMLIQSLSQSDATREIVLLEQDSYNCADFHSDQWNCNSHFNLYDSDYLQRQAVYTLPPIDVAGRTYSQRGAFVFHSADGLHRYLISRLYGLPNNGQQFYITQQQ
jgi:hypothetical protein